MYIRYIHTQLSCNLIVTDPPYNVNYGSKDTKKRNIENDNLCEDDFKKLLKNVFNNYVSLMTDSTSYYVFSCQGGDNEMMMMMMMRESGMKCRHQLIWIKNMFSFSMNRLDYDYQHEPILYGWNKTHKFYAKEHQVSLLKYDREQNVYHPTQKPIALISKLIMNSSKENDIVCDLFAGGGSVLLACEINKRKFVGCEIDSHYCDVIIHRWEKLTHKKAYKFMDGEKQ